MQQIYEVKVITLTRGGADEKIRSNNELQEVSRSHSSKRKGTNGMTVEEALPRLKEHREELLESTRNGKYRPSPVRRAEIPKDDGGVRKLQYSDKSSNRAFPVFPDGKTVDFNRRYQRNRGLLRGLLRGFP